MEKGEGDEKVGRRQNRIEKQEKRLDDGGRGVARRRRTTRINRKTRRRSDWVEVK